MDIRATPCPCDHCSKVWLNEPRAGLPTFAGSQFEGMHSCTRTSVSRMACLLTRVNQP